MSSDTFKHSSNYFLFVTSSLSYCVESRHTVQYLFTWLILGLSFCVCCAFSFWPFPFSVSCPMRAIENSNAVDLVSSYTGSQAQLLVACAVTHTSPQCRHSILSLVAQCTSRLLPSVMSSVTIFVNLVSSIRHIYLNDWSFCYWLLPAKGFLEKLVTLKTWWYAKQYLQINTWYCCRNFIDILMLVAVTMTVGSGGGRSDAKPTSVPCSICRAWTGHDAWGRTWWPVAASAIYGDTSCRTSRHDASVTSHAYDERLHCCQQQAGWRRWCQLWWPRTKIRGAQETQIGSDWTQSNTACRTF